MQSSLDGMVFAQGTKLQNTQPTYLHKNNLYSDWFIKECYLGETMWTGYSAIAPHEVTDDITFLKKWQGPCRSEERRVGEEGRSRWSPDH